MGMGCGCMPLCVLVATDEAYRFHVLYLALVYRLPVPAHLPRLPFNTMGDFRYRFTVCHYVGAYVYTR